MASKKYTKSELFVDWIKKGEQSDREREILTNLLKENDGFTDFNYPNINEINRQILVSGRAIKEYSEATDRLVKYLTDRKN